VSTPIQIIGKAPRRIGMLGGSFDPVHRGHLHAARAALAAKSLDRVVFVPAAEPPHKVGLRLASGADRLAMLALAIRDEPCFSACDIELQRGGRSYTIDTVRALRAYVNEPANAALYLILGSDNVPGLATWHYARALIDLVHPVVVQRDTPHSIVEEGRMLTAIARELGDEAALKLRAGWLRLAPVPVSSTNLRIQLPALGPAVVANGLDPAVLEYIRAHGLYGTSA
jgi:nicotinate-nucleotide adenylyltransferase